eukprot:GEMP01058517.1.p1 GENE.GEMP01058517.1~~GEMP01058517.1.p1  ORF type:complete len:288 (+),score=65.42 GEMP01058517.1:33-896(+)
MTVFLKHIYIKQMDGSNAAGVPVDLSATDAVSPTPPLHPEIQEQPIDDAAASGRSSPSANAVQAEHGEDAEERGVEDAPIVGTHRANADRQPASAAKQADVEDVDAGEKRLQTEAVMVAEHVDRVPERDAQGGSIEGETGAVKTGVDESRNDAETDRNEPMPSERGSQGDGLTSAKVKQIREELDALHASLLQKARTLSDGLPPFVADPPCGPASLQRAPSSVPSVTALSLAQARDILKGPSVSDVKSKSSSTSRRTRTSRSRTHAAPCALPAERLKSAISILTTIR